MVKLQSNGDYWQAVWTDGLGRRRAKGLGHKSKSCRRQALAQCQRIAAEHVVNPGMVSAGKAPSLRSCLERALADRAHLSETRRRSLRNTMRSLIGVFGGDTRIDRITRAMAADWRAGLCDALMPATVALHTVNARLLIGDAVAQDRIAANPFDRLPRRSVKAKATWHHVTTDEMCQIIDASKCHKMRAALALCRLAGLRRGESLTARWDQVDWLRRRLTVKDHKRSHCGKGKRVVPIVPELYHVLVATQERSRDAVICRMSEASAYKRLVKAIADAGLGPWSKPWQIMRRSCETDWAKIYPMSVVSEWIGHGITISQDHYLQVTDDMYDRAAGQHVNNAVTIH